jgi:predicted HAD superfamily Cof-like phosphohydrolase
MITQKMVEEFHAAMGQPVCRKLNDDEYRLRLRLIGEEWTEFAEAAAAMDLNAPQEEFLKEMADLIYVLLGTAVAMGMNIDEAFERVHRSNMSKLGPDGKPVVRADGKVLKGPDYRLPDLRGCVPTYTLADEF